MEKEFSTKDREELLNTLKARFEKNISRHKDLEWPKVQAKLEAKKTEKLWSLNEMERTGSSYITTVRSLTTLPGGFAAR